MGPKESNQTKQNSAQKEVFFFIIPTMKAPPGSLKYIEDIYFFEVNTKHISSSAVKKKQYFSRVRSTSENADIFTARDVIYFVFAVKK